MSRLSGSDEVIIEAIEKGYYADCDGNIYNKAGRKLSACPKRDGHLSVTFNIKRNGRKRPVLAHRFIAYYFYGDDLFNNECVRHLNDVPSDNRLCNLALGSFKENRADIPKEVLSRNAKKNAHLLVERSRKLLDEDIILMRNVCKDTNKSFATIAKEFGVSTMTAYRAITKQSWSNV